MLEMTGAASKIEGLLQVLRESDYAILEVSRTGRMAMRRGHHTSRVLKALGTEPASPNALLEDAASFSDKPEADEILPNEFDDVHEEEEL